MNRKRKIEMIRESITSKNLSMFETLNLLYEKNNFHQDKLGPMIERYPDRPNLMVDPFESEVFIGSR